MISWGISPPFSPPNSPIGERVFKNKRVLPRPEPLGFGNDWRWRLAPLAVAECLKGEQAEPLANIKTNGKRDHTFDSLLWQTWIFFSGLKQLGMGELLELLRTYLLAHIAVDLTGPIFVILAFEAQRFCLFKGELGAVFLPAPPYTAGFEAWRG